MSRDSIVAGTAGLVSLLRILNLVFGLLALLLVIGSFPAEGLLAARLAAKYRGAVDPGTLVWALRALATLGLLGVAIVDRILRELRGVLTTLQLGDPFAPANAGRITVIAWALLIWQLLELVLGALNWWITRLGADTGGWTPSLGGWLSVLVAFVLARVFATGSRMREELAATI